MFKGLWLICTTGVLGFAPAFLLCRCTDDDGLLIPNRENRRAPVSALKFVPQRKYVSNSGNVPIMVEGYNTGFTCSHIDRFALETQGNTLIPDIQVTFPETIDECPQATTDQDSLIFYDFSDWATTPSMAYLQNSGGSVTDSAVVVAASHREDSLTFFIEDSVTIATIDDPFLLLEDSLKLSRCDSLSYGFLCYGQSQEVDTLWLWIAVAKGLKDVDCDSTYAYQFEDGFIKVIQRESFSQCQEYVRDSLLAAP